MRFTIALLGLILLAGCEDIQVQRVEPRAAPVAFSTYAWGQAALSDVPDASAQLVELDKDMRGVVTAEMAARGYRLVEDPARADMMVDYQVSVIQEEFSANDTPPSWNAQFDNNAVEGAVELPARSGAPRVTLSLGIGRADGAPIWGGSASKLLARPESAETRQRVLRAAVQDLLRDLPPAAY